MATDLDPAAAIHHSLRFPEPATHYVEVTSVFPAGSGDSLELLMAVWTPGSYLVREFARQVEGLRAKDSRGTPLPVRKSRKNRWRVELGEGGDSTVEVSYRLYCREMSVRTNFVDDSFALLQGAATFLVPVGRLDLPHRVQVQPADGWERVLTALPPAEKDSETVFGAEDYDHLVDSPIYAGSPTVHAFEVAGIPHLLVDEGGGEIWDSAAAAAETERIVRQEIDFWGQAPYERFLFLNLMVETGGGLEHKDSTVLMTSRWRRRTRQGRLAWLGLVSHELFHAWNGKRLRPVELGPFDYENEVYTRGLWVVEGMTSYYDDLLLRRAGLMSHKEYLRALSKTLERVQTTPGRRVQALTGSSFDAWIKLYRRDENSVNSSISYYPKGALVAWLLDVELRRRSDDQTSLDDLMRAAYARFSGPRGHGEGEFRALANEVAGGDLDPFFVRAVDGTGELDFDPALRWFGLRFESPDTAATEGDEEEAASGWLGARVSKRAGRLLTTAVPRETPVHAAGLQVGDEILALAGYRVLAGKLGERLKAFSPGDTVALLVARRERLVRLAVTLGEKPAKAWRLEIDPEATAEQQARLIAWLGEDGVH